MSKLRIMMIKRKLILITVLFVFVITGFRLLWYGINEPPSHPSVEKGVIDLRSWNFSTRQTIPLNGEWEFYPGKWVQPGNVEVMDRDKLKIGYISVPGKWNSSMNTDSSFGFATYRLKIRISHAQEAYSLNINSIQTAAKIYMNGKLLMEAGLPGSGPQESKPRNYPYTISFIPDQEEIDLLIQVSNYDYPHSGGITESVQFGTESAVKYEHHFYMRLQIIVYTVLVLHLVYAGVLSLIGIRSRTLLYMSLAICFMVMSNLVDGARWLLIWIPITPEWSFKLSVIAYLSTTIFLVLGTTQLSSGSRFRALWKWTLYISIVSVIVIPFLPLWGVLLLGNIFWLLMLLNITQVLILTFHSISREKKGGVFLLLSAVSIASLAFWSIVKHSFWPEMPYYPIDSIFAYLGFAAFWFTRFFQAHEQTRNWTHKLREADKQKDDYLTFTSLELGAPLQGMMGIAKSVLEERRTTLSPRSREDLELIIQVGQRMSVMLGDLLDIKRLNAQEIRLSPKSISLAPVVSSVFSMLRFMTEGKKVELVPGVPGNFPHVYADENRLIQILFNLVHNALKYTNEGLIMVYADIQDSMVRIHVEDSGIGVDEDIQQIIFLPYEQGSSTDTEALGGLGLGLSICRQLVQLHGGEITVSSKPGNGSIFTFTLPLG
ncbi:Autoinducer 2 sensor kinase/phosphatase LuxQ [compost metagenome]